MWRGEANENVNEEKPFVTEEIALPGIKMDDTSLLASVTASEFTAEQKKNETTKELWNRVGETNEREFERVNDRLIRNYKSKRNAERQKLIVPLIFKKKKLWSYVTPKWRVI